MIRSEKISSIWNPYPAALLYLLFVLWIGVSAARQGISNYYADAAIFHGSASEAAAAVAWQPENPNAYRSRGAIFLQDRDFAGAATEFEQAISFRSNDLLLWLGLGSARYGSGEVAAAGTAYQRALFLAPGYSETNYQMGKFYLDTSQPEKAFQFLSKAAENDPQRYPGILKLAYAAFPGDAAAIENSIQPKSVEAKKILASFLIQHDLMTDSVRIFLLSDELTESERSAFVGLLIAKEKYSLARQIWLSSLKIGEGRSDDAIFDGGFEWTTESDASGFGWQIDQKSAALTVSIDETAVHSGSRSVLVDFKGNVDFDRQLVSQLVYLDPREKYELRFFARSTELISAGPPVIAINDRVTKELLGRTGPLRSTGGEWAEIRVPFTTKECPVVTVSLLRTGCDTSPCPIFGDLSLDDFSVTKVKDDR